MEGVMKPPPAFLAALAAGAARSRGADGSPWNTFLDVDLARTTLASADGEASRTAAAARKARGLGMEGGAVWACGVWRERGERRKEGEVERERGGGRGGGSGGGGGAREERAGRAARLGPTRSNCHPSRSRWSPLDATPRGALSAKGGAHAESTLRARRSLSSIVRLSVFSSLPLSLFPPTFPASGGAMSSLLCRDRLRVRPATTWVERARAPHGGRAGGLMPAKTLGRRFAAPPALPRSRAPLRPLSLPPLPPHSPALAGAAGRDREARTATVIGA